MSCFSALAKVLHHGQASKGSDMHNPSESLKSHPKQAITNCTHSSPDKKFSHQGKTIVFQESKVGRCTSNKWTSEAYYSKGSVCCNRGEKCASQNKRLESKSQARRVSEGMMNSMGITWV
jgi:hypothetical protein